MIRIRFGRGTGSPRTALTQMLFDHGGPAAVHSDESRPANQEAMDDDVAAVAHWDATMRYTIEAHDPDEAVTAVAVDGGPVDGSEAG